MKTTDTLPLYLDSQALEKGRKVDNLHMQCNRLTLRNIEAKSATVQQYVVCHNSACMQ